MERKKKKREKAARSRCLWRTFNKTGTRLFFTKKIRGNYRIAHPVQKLSDRFHAPSTEVSPLPRDQSRWSPENPAGKIRANWRCRWPSKWESAALPSRSPLWLLVVKGGGVDVLCTSEFVLDQTVYRLYGYCIVPVAVVSAYCRHGSPPSH